MKTISNSKTYFVMEDESGNLTFDAVYNITEGGKMTDGRVSLIPSPKALREIKEFIENEVKPQIQIKEK